MIDRQTLEDAIYRTVKRGSCEISPDVRSAFQRAAKSERSERAKNAFETTLESMDKSKTSGNLLCADTGWPLFFCKIGDGAEIEGGITGFEEVAKRMVVRATEEGYLRATMKHPLTGADPGANVGENVPAFTHKFVPGDSVQVTFVAKGGGSECFGGTRYGVVAFADGTAGIKKSIIDWYIAAARAGAICPPSVMGIGIGGTADAATHLAKQAAALRLIGSRHPDADMAELEEDLMTAINGLGIGPMGLGGDVSVYAVNVEYSLTHLGGITLAMSTNCWVARRATTRIRSDGSTERLDDPNWFDGR